MVQTEKNKNTFRDLFTCFLLSLDEKRT